MLTTFLLPTTAITSLDEYLATEVGGLGVASAQRLGPRATIDTVARSGLRGRGGGGFPTGRKWAGIADQTGTRRYLDVLAGDGEFGRSISTVRNNGRSSSDTADSLATTRRFASSC